LCISLSNKLGKVNRRIYFFVGGRFTFGNFCQFFHKKEQLGGGGIIEH